MGHGRYTMSDAEQPMYEELRTRSGYLGNVRKFYAEVEPQVARLPYVINASRMFENVSDVYRDGRHQNEKGVKMIAKLIYELVQERLAAKKTSNSVE